MRSLKPILKEGQNCPNCLSGTIVRRNGRYGDFMACDNYPRCMNIGRVLPELNSNDFQTQDWLAKRGKQIDPVI